MYTFTYGNHMHDSLFFCRCNSEKNVKIGERENRIYSAFVRNKYIGFGHGIGRCIITTVDIAMFFSYRLFGRSGNLDEAQPKSAGNSVLAKVTTRMVKNIIRSFGIKSCKEVYILPYATGMCISTCLLYLKRLRTKSEYVLISRIDHKTCYKCIDFCNLKYIVIDMIFRNNELWTDTEKIKNVIEEYGDKICCVISVTSSYAPRNADDIVKISLLCSKFDIPHIINNAFGLQCIYICKEIQKCFDLKGRIDFIVQSCDKNFLLPVCGSIVFSSNKNKIKEMKKLYPGRTPVHAYLDLFITLLELGKNKILQLRKERVKNFEWLKEQVTELCLKYHLHLIKTSRNFISMAINLNQLYKYSGKDNPRALSLLGSFLFYRNVTGHRVICSPMLTGQCVSSEDKREAVEAVEAVEAAGAVGAVEAVEAVEAAGAARVASETNEAQEDVPIDAVPIRDVQISCSEKEKANGEASKRGLSPGSYSYPGKLENEAEKSKVVIGNHTFQNFGSSCDAYPFSYIAFSCVIGIERPELKRFVQKLDDSISHFIRHFQPRHP
ncbi:O-phosphoseryl-tRNA(Sec) selenium transferase, putative (SEPSECS) [Plasmodium ovale wallikeri]|uniref:O-phosphoseryl-tRNA(Sec) selenium transferase n=1 Tax=Plasmodium ovale wallikeri TaxID=864142 RepID=A0A1A8ZJZ9_PLAOA|nr:O-phosphoseryl-tRNA(Sec) selenium transferase, putative (SEPSECS) [Plasmodium ovale wallikeri]